MQTSPPKWIKLSGSALVGCHRSRAKQSRLPFLQSPKFPLLENSGNDFFSVPLGCLRTNVHMPKPTCELPSFVLVPQCLEYCGSRLAARRLFPVAWRVTARTWQMKVLVQRASSLYPLPCGTVFRGKTACFWYRRWGLGALLPWGWLERGTDVVLRPWFLVLFSQDSSVLRRVP